MYSPLILPPTIDEVQQALLRPLPGVAGQVKMAPQPRPGEVSRWDKPADCREAGVLLLLYPHATNGREPELHLVLIRRPDYPGVHGGQISFPGGRREGTETLQVTALRETLEEIGVPPDTVKVIGQLSPLYTPPSNFCIFPFVAYRAEHPTFNLNPNEVAAILEPPLSHLLDPTARKEELWHFPRDGERRIPFFDVFGYKVWGATAMMLSEFISLLTTSVTGAKPSSIDD
jgi:8-oxo-dGTP pyrophosphatase MutT (NUDIX family)